jgi:hypothetical protein
MVNGAINYFRNSNGTDVRWRRVTIFDEWRSPLQSVSPFATMTIGGANGIGCIDIGDNGSSQNRFDFEFDQLLN